MGAALAALAVSAAFAASIGFNGQDRGSRPASTYSLSNGLIPAIRVSRETPGPYIHNLVDVALWRDSIVVLDRYGLVWIFDPDSVRIPRVVSLEQAIGSRPNNPLNLVVGDSSISAWDAQAQTLYTLSRGGTGWRETFADRYSKDLHLSAILPLRPPRMHGRLVGDTSEYHIEIRRGEEQHLGPQVQAYLVSYSHGKYDTIASYRAPSQSESRNGVRICCRRSPIYAAQPLWGVLSDGRVAFAPGSTPQVRILSRTGQVDQEVEAERVWPVVRIRQSTIEQYLVRGAHETLSHDRSADKELIGREAERRVRRYPGAVSAVSPAITQLLVDDQDRVWTRLSDPARWPEGLSVTWVVLDKQLIPQGHLDLPTMDYVFAIHGAMVIGARVVHGTLYQLRIAWIG